MKCRVIIIKYEHKQIAGGSKGVTKDKSVSLFSTTHWRFAAHLLAHVSSCTPAGLMLSLKMHPSSMLNKPNYHESLASVCISLAFITGKASAS